MRRVMWSVLTGLGAFFIVLALLFAFLLPGQVVKYPLNEYSKSTLTGTGLSYFSAPVLKVLHGVQVRVTDTAEGDVAAADAAGSSRIAVYHDFEAVRDVTNNVPISYTYESLAFDRRTGQLVRCCHNVIGTARNPSVSGQGFYFPINTQPHSYQVFDTTLLKPVTFRYAGTASTDGVSTYKFVEDEKNQQVGNLTLPGSLVGMSALSVTLPEFYTIRTTEWVDPVTGAALQYNEFERQTLQDSSGAVALVLYSGDVKSTPQSVSSTVSADKSMASKIGLVEVIVPIAAGVLGVILVVVGLLLSRRRPQQEELTEEDVEPVGSPS